MSQLLQYLNTKHQTSTMDEVKADFNTFGVDIKTEGDLTLLKYDMIAVKWDSVIPHECRGHILTRENGMWRFVSRPWSKFFNVSEGHSGIHESESFKEWAEKTNPYIMQKVDGSAIQVYFCNNAWKASTLGTITPFKVADYQFTFDELFWNIIKADNAGKINTDYLDEHKDYTFLFELCSVYNRILTKYPTDRVYLISVRHNVMGTYWKQDQLAEAAKALGVMIPAQYTFKELGIDSLEKANKFVEDASLDNAKYGEYSEGFVVYNDGTPKGKIKNSKYKVLHRFSGADVGCSVNGAIECFFNNAIDDVWGALPDVAKELVEKIRAKVLDIRNNVMDTIEKIQAQTFPTQKDYALFIMKNVPEKRVHSFMFAMKDKIMNKTITKDDFSDWLRGHYEKWEWKKDLMI